MSMGLGPSSPPSSSYDPSVHTISIQLATSIQSGPFNIG